MNCGNSTTICGGSGVTGNEPLFTSVRSTLEWGMQQTRTELCSLPRFPVEFIEIPAIHGDTEVRPNETADDHYENPSHNHRKNLISPTSIRRFWASGSGLPDLCTSKIVCVPQRVSHSVRRRNFHLPQQIHDLLRTMLLPSPISGSSYTTDMRFARQPMTT